MTMKMKLRIMNGVNCTTLRLCVISGESRAGSAGLEIKYVYLRTISR